MPRTVFLLSALALGWASPGFVDTARAQDEAAPLPASCRAVDAERSLGFFGQSLRDTPGLASADARRLNSLLARGECADAAAADITTRLAANPDDEQMAFLEARLDALAGRRPVAERRIDALLARAPALQPAQVLKAALLLDREQRVEARTWLDKAATARPDDLRVAFLRLRLDALDAPKGEGAGQLAKVMRDDSLPPDLREDAQATLLYLTALDIDRKEAALREGLTFASQTPRWNKSIALARLLAEEAGKPAEARKVLEPLVADKATPEDARHEAAVLLSEAWLLEAARIDPAPTARNAPQVAKARAAVEGDMVPVAGRIRRYHDLSALMPFVADVVDPEARGPDGLTLLCRGAQLLDASKVRRALEAGAAVDGECSGSTPLAYVVRQGPGLWSMKTDLLAVLLAAGADPDPKLYPGSSFTAMSFCAESLKGCEETLLPLLKEAAATRAARKP
jgi:hypothetical protein